MELNKDASTQYGDMKGTVAIDWHEVPQFSEFVKKHGIDTDRFMPLAIEIYAGELSESISIYAVEQPKVGNSVDEMTEYARRNGRRLPVKKFDLECSFNDLLKATKRFNLIALRSWTKEFSIDVEDE